MNTNTPHLMLRDLPLPLPVSRTFLEVLVVVTFIAHILFVNLMVGGSILAFVFEFAGLKNPRHDRLARSIAQTITVNKSLAVVLGVGPLLAMNLLHTIHFYGANQLTGIAWIMVIPLVTAAFLLTYLHKYSWDSLAGRKPVHLAIGALPVVLFLGIPFIFLANANLMLFPERWTDVRGFFQAVLLPNVFPRYTHFLLASLAVTALFLAAWLGRAAANSHPAAAGYSRAGIMRLFYRITFGVSVAQFVAGPVVFFTLPRPGVNSRLVIAILAGAIFALAALVLLRKEISAPDHKVGRRYWSVVALLGLTVGLMAFARHSYREARLSPHHERMEQESADFRRRSQDAAKQAEPPAEASAPPDAD